MADSYPYSKVTIVIESEDRVTKYTIPKAREVEVDSNAMARPLGGYFSSTIDLSLTLKADFDNEKQHLFLIEESSIGRPVEAGETNG